MNFSENWAWWYTTFTRTLCMLAEEHTQKFKNKLRLHIELLSSKTDTVTCYVKIRNKYKTSKMYVEETHTHIHILWKSNHGLPWMSLSCKGLLNHIPEEPALALWRLTLSLILNCLYGF